MKLLKFWALALITLVVVFSSCEDEVEVKGLTYALNGSDTMLKPDSTLASTADYAIVAYANGGQSLITIYLSSFQTGTYTIQNSKAVKSFIKAASGNSFSLYYNTSALMFGGTTGTLTISNYESNKLSGTYEVTAGWNESTSGQISSIKGSFNDVPVVSRYITAQ